MTTSSLTYVLVGKSATLLSLYLLTRWGLVTHTHIYIIELAHHWFRLWLDDDLLTVGPLRTNFTENQTTNLRLRKCFRICRWQSDRHIVQASICYLHRLLQWLGVKCAACHLLNKSSDPDYRQCVNRQESQRSAFVGVTPRSEYYGLNTSQ